MTKITNHVALGALRRRLGIDAPIPVRVPASPCLSHPFPDSVWRAESDIREAIDTLIYPMRWRVIWLPTEHGQVRPRTFYLTGSHASVTARVHAFFTSGTVVVDPAPFAHGPERIDRRLNLCGSNSP